jgi:small subunit ribosomal protein S2e
MIGNAHTVPCKVHGKSGSVRIRMIHEPRGTGIVAAPASKKVI